MECHAAEINADATILLSASSGREQVSITRRRSYVSDGGEPVLVAGVSLAGSFWRRDLGSDSVSSELVDDFTIGLSQVIVAARSLVSLRQEIETWFAERHSFTLTLSPRQAPKFAVTIGSDQRLVLARGKTAFSAQYVTIPPIFVEVVFESTTHA